MSLAGVAQKQRDLLKVESLLASAEDLLRHMRKVPMLRFAWALARGQEAAATRNFPVALTFFNRAVRYARQAGDLAAESVGLQNLGAAHTDAGDHKAAIRWFRRGLQVAESLGLVLEPALLCDGLANANIGLGRRHEAIKFYQQARQLYLQADHAPRLAMTTANLGALLVEAGQAVDGRGLYWKPSMSSKIVAIGHGKHVFCTISSKQPTRLKDQHKRMSLLRRSWLYYH